MRSHRSPLRPAVPPRRTAGALALALSLAWAPAAPAQVSPQESAGQLKPADGLEATLWAAEPLVVNPTTIDVDSRGRVWVTEGLNYRLHRNRNQQFSRVEEADRVKILEDTDGDGAADKVTVFADHIFPVPMGIAVEEHYNQDGSYAGCKVYVGNSPNLLVLEDTDGDDKADRRYPLLTGFGGIDSDHGVHGMVLGLDGKLYFTHGDGCCSVQPEGGEKPQNFDVIDQGGRHVVADNLATTLRVNRDGTEFEILADRQRNNYETSLNSFGNIFTSDNDDDGNRGSRVIWVMDGGHYGYRTPGSPRHWGEDVPGNVPKLVGTGNGSPCGIMVYEGALLPEEYFGAVFEVDAGTRQVNSFPITRHGAAFRTESKVLLGSDDPWFRPVDATAAPDGAVFVADWYDAGVGGHAFRDQTTGRIYRVAPKGAKTKAVKSDFGTVPGLIAALKAPVVATRDAARRGLIARAHDDTEGVVRALKELSHDRAPTLRARALWVLQAIVGDEVALAALRDDDPRIREQAVRMLGRDAREFGKVSYIKRAAQKPPAALEHLNALRHLATDPDPGVRRELILALRNLRTDRVGEALKELAREWDGRDRWYLEALGLALKDREGGYLAGLFDGQLYGDLGLPDAGQAVRVALPPYFPVDRNEAFLATGEELPPASALSRTLGLAWIVHRPEILPLMGKLMPELASPELQQAADDVIMQIDDTAGAVALAGMAQAARDPVRKRQMLDALARKLDGSWREAKDRPEVARAIEAALDDPEVRAQGIRMAAATGEGRYAEAIAALARDDKAPEEVRVAAIEALGRLKPTGARELMDGLIAATKGRSTSDPAAQAAVRARALLGGADDQMVELMASDQYPPGLRREALRALARGEGINRLVAMIQEDRLPAELKTEALTTLYIHPDMRIRFRLRDILPKLSDTAGRQLPPIFMILRGEGKPERGREVFFRQASNACAGCHRVQGRGQWVGPDLSTIGTKYGRDELLRSILNPNAAIGYNYRPYVVALADGRVVTGLPVDESADRLVLKTAEGERVAVRTAEIEEKRQSEISLMPEGLAQAMGDQELVDLLAFLETLKRPVSVVGVYHALGPVAGEDAKPALDPTARVDLAAAPKATDGAPLAWRRLTADAEGRVDLTTLAGPDASRAVYLYAPVTSPVEQPARLVLDTKAGVRAWLGGRPVALSDPTDEDPARSADVTLPKGTTDLLIRVPGGAEAAVVTTLVADRPFEFSAVEAKAPGR